MERKEKKKPIDLLEVFNEPDRRLLLFKFDGLVRHLSLTDRKCCRLSGGQCHDINQVVTLITERLIQLVAAAESKFEALLYAIPWAKYLFEGAELPNVNRLQADVFVRLWSEYIAIFPHKSDKFIDSFMFLLRGDKSVTGDDPALSLEEVTFFSALTSAMGELLGKVRTFEASLVGALKRRFPFYHNASVHEFTSYIGNLLSISDLLPVDSGSGSGSEHYLELQHFLYGHLLAVDNRQFFEDVSERHVRDGSDNGGGIIFEFEDINTTSVADLQEAAASVANTSITADERLKKFKVLDGACHLLFRYIDRQLSSTTSTSSNPNSSSRAIAALISLFFSRLLTGSSLHVQYLAFYLCGRSAECCDAFVNDLWTISVSGSETLAVREGAFSYLVSLLRHAHFIHLNTVFSFLKILVQAMNGHLDSKLTQQQQETLKSSNNHNSLIDHDVMYYNFALGFARLFTAFHSELAAIQVDCLKSMDLKRALMSSDESALAPPVHYFPAGLRTAFHAVASYYRIGYFNVKRLGEPSSGQQRQLSSLSAAHRDDPPRFGRIRLPAVRTAVAPLVNSAETLFEAAAGFEGAHRGSSSHLLMNSPTDRGRGGGGRGGGGGCWSDMRRSPALSQQMMMAASPTTATNTSGDDGLFNNGFLSSPGSYTPSSSVLMASMLSDMD